MLLADDLKQLLNILPDFIQKPLNNHPKQELLIEIVPEIINSSQFIFLYIIFSNIEHNQIIYFPCPKRTIHRV